MILPSSHLTWNSGSVCVAMEFYDSRVTVHLLSKPLATAVKKKIPGVCRSFVRNMRFRMLRLDAVHSFNVAYGRCFFRSPLWKNGDFTRTSQARSLYWRVAAIFFSGGVVGCRVGLHAAAGNSLMFVICIIRSPEQCQNCNNPVVFSNIFCIHPDTWGNDPIWRACFSIGLKPPTSQSR